MDKQVKNFNTRLRTIKLRELIIGVLIALILTGVLMVIFPIIETNDDLLMIVFLILILIFFIWCLKGTEGLSANLENLLLKDTKNEILYVFALNIIFAYIFLFSIVVLDAIIGISDPTWVSIIDIDSVSLTPTAFLYTAISSIIFAPVLEELIFRGVIFNRLKIRTGFIPAMLISSFLFAIGHDFGGIISAFLFGMCMCILYMKTDNILVPMSVHFINNAVATVLEITPIDSILTSFPWIILLGIAIFIATLLLMKYILTETRTLNNALK
ncbi:CPBP family intramembrane glutamic endopeptidase [Methanobrevibacter sp.]|uniref:CPBP family intramembrane glutamic endopeptidase n=1 Tax=Methanobrevibacter sp. TaxID=66852 RepID=UPI0026E039F1|nr:CPBP family intramembrane glutamic endopeptidase [Methanobrevibacter sp.]MDO5860200.1 CPBP family intramembrane metalloprotease [Methanobrevibacter sp.]